MTVFPICAMILGMERNHAIEYFTLLLKGEDLLGILDENLPTPNKIQLMHGLVPKFAIMYHIAGYTGTKKSREFFNDIVARFCLTLPVQERLPFELDTEYQTERIYHLKEFQNLKSLKTHFGAINYNPSNNDLIFWSLKVYVEQNIISLGGFVPYQSVEIWAFGMFEAKAKDRSTLRAKCRKVWNWYEKRDWRLSLLAKRNRKSKEEVMATRLEHIEKVNAERAKKSKRAVWEAIHGLEKEEFLKNDGTWNVSAIARSRNMDVKTVRKYLKELAL